MNIMNMINSNIIRQSTYRESSSEDESNSPENYSFDYDVRDENYHYLINYNFDNIPYSNYEILCTARNNKYIAVLYLINKQYELIILFNDNKLTTKVKFKTYRIIRLKQLLNEYNSTYINKDSEGRSKPKSPSIYICCDNYIIIEDSKKIYLLDFTSNKFITLFVKIQQLNIISAFDELYSYNNDVHERSYIFCVSDNEDLYYFMLECDFFFKENKQVVLYKLTACERGIKDFQIIKFNNDKEKTWHYMLVLLKPSFFKVYITGNTRSSVKALLSSYFILNYNTYKGDSVVIPVENKKVRKRIFVHFSSMSRCALMIANGELISVVEFDSFSTPEDLKKYFKFDAFRRRNSIGPIRSIKSSLGLNNFDINSSKSDEIKILDISIHDIDFDNYSLCYVKEKVLIISKENIILIELNKGKVLYKYVTLTDLYRHY
jgi:hypothetical protein